MSYRTEHPAFVLSMFDTGLDVGRCLGRFGIKVYGLDFDPAMPGFKSHYCKPLICPHPIRQPEMLLEFMIAEGRKLGFPGIIFVATDAFLLFLSKFRRELSRYYRFNIPPENVVESIVNKGRQYQLAEKNGIPCPQTICPETPDDADRFAHSVCYPVFLKPCYSYAWQEKYPSIKGFKVMNADELRIRLRELLRGGVKVMVQSIIPGPNTNHYKYSAYITEEGRTMAFFTLRKIRQYPPEFGVGSCVESMRCDRVKELGSRFLQNIAYRGVGSVEFKQDARDGKLKLIELNPRYWQQHSLADACGINFPLVQYLDLTGQKPAPKTQFKTGLKWFDLIPDFQSFWYYFKKNELTLKQWLTSLRGTRAFAAFSCDDPLPFFKNIEYGLKLLKIPWYLCRRHRAE